MNLRYVVPALGLVALSVTAASAQEIAKGVTLDGYVDTVGTATRGNDAFGGSTTDFSSEAVLMVGWAPTDRISAKVSTRTGTADAGSSLDLVEAWGSIKATDQLTIATGKSYGPFGYYSPYATGINFVTGVLSTHLYTVNPVGAWATYTVNDKLNATFILADTFFGGNKANRPASVSPGLDVVFAPTPEVSLNLELAADPNGGAEGDDGAGDVYYASLNAQYKKDALTVAGEFLYQVKQNAGEDTDSDQKNLAWAAFVTYAIPDMKIPMAVTAQVSGFKDGETAPTAGTFAVDPDTGLVVAGPGTTGDKHTATKAQLALLTNPLSVSQFGLNFELFYMTEDVGGDSDKINSYGVAIEGLYVLP